MEKLTLSELYKKNPAAYFGSTPDGQTFCLFGKMTNTKYEMFEIQKVNKDGTLFGFRTSEGGHLYVYEVEKPTTIEDVAHNSRWQQVRITSKHVSTIVSDAIVWRFGDGLDVAYFGSNLPVATINGGIKSVVIEDKILKLEVGD